MADAMVAQLDEIEEIDDGVRRFRPVRQHFDIRTFGVTAVTASAAGELLINEHDETEPDSSEELYVVVSGHATFQLGGETHEAPAPAFVHVPAGVTRKAVARDAGTTVLAIGGAPEGKPYDASNWELFSPLFPLFQSGEYQLGADRAEALLESGGPHGAAIHYNTACFQSLAGRREAALANLRLAVERAPSMAELAREDDDFGALREDPAFAEILASAEGAAG